MPTNPLEIFRQPLAKVSIRKTEVEATPLTVRAVVEAYGKVEAVVEVEVKNDERTLLVNTPLPATERFL